MTIYYTHVHSPLGRLLLVSDSKNLLGIHMEKSKHGIKKQPDWVENPSLFKQTIVQLNKYFTGKLKKFSVKLSGQGTDFQKQVWKELSKIPFGKTVSYAEIAKGINKPTAVRAVANAIGRNPIPIIVPCHRVIGSNGSLTGYAGGLPRKKLLLGLENISF